MMVLLLMLMKGMTAFASYVCIVGTAHRSPSSD